MPPNTLAIVEPDAAFIEAYMVGLNHEMARELLWRAFPTDQRGTVFSRFWDRRGAVATTVSPVPERDIPSIDQWHASANLGENLAGGGASLVVLLIRGELLQRYPGATLYAHRARWKRDQQGAIIVEDGLGTTRRAFPPLADASAAISPFSVSA
jgi:hypothetical protein